MRDGAKLDGRADIFAFGAVIYYCRYGTVPAVEATKSVRSGRTAADRFSSKACKTFQNIIDSSLLRNRIKNRRNRGRALPSGLAAIVRRCLQKEPADRYADSGQLREALRLAWLKYRRKKQTWQITAAAALLAGLLIFFRTMDGAENDAAENDAAEYNAAEHETADSAELQSESGRADSDTQNPEYYRLLEMAEGLGFAQAMECYGEAASMYPGEETWYLCVLDWVQADSLFDEEEENAVRELWYAADEQGITRVEHLKADPEAYGRMAWRLGLVYWYFYSGSGGKSAAARWFEQAVSVLEDGKIQAEWAQDARLHAQISSYYGMLGRSDDETEREQKEWEYWQDLKKLWNMQAADREEKIIRKMAEEMLNRMIIDASLLSGRGETKEALEELLDSIEVFLTAPEQTETDGEKAVVTRLRSLCNDARAAIARTFPEGDYAGET